MHLYISSVESTGRAHSRNRLSQPRTKQTYMQENNESTCIYIYLNRYRYRYRYRHICIYIYLRWWSRRGVPTRESVCRSRERSTPWCGWRGSVVFIYLYLNRYRYRYRYRHACIYIFLRWSRRGVPTRESACHSPGQSIPANAKERMKTSIYLYICIICISISVSISIYEASAFTEALIAA